MIGLPTIVDGELLLPATRQITPSRFEPWRGVRAPDQRYTHYQRRELVHLEIDEATVEDIIIRDKATTREMYWGTLSKAPVYLMPCPILDRLKNGYLLVLSPAGVRKIVHESGTKGAYRRGR